MVNTGKPSEGCVRCRSRRVRCDLTLPGCARCVRLGQPCPGYQQRNDTKAITFKDATDATRTRARRIYNRLEDQQSTRKVSKATPRRPLDYDAPAFDMSSLSSLKDFIITGAVSTLSSHWREGSVPLFDANFHFASKLYPTCEPCLQAAVETYALWAMALDMPGSAAALQNNIMQTYGRTLGTINHALAHFNTVEADHVLLAIEMVGVFEMIALEKPAGGDPYTRGRAHLYGLFCIMGARGAHQFASDLGRRLFLDIFMLFIIGSIALPDPVPSPLPGNACELLLHEFEASTKPPEYAILPLLQRGLGLRILFQYTYAHTTPGAAQVHDLLKQALALKLDLAQFHNSLPDNYAREDLGARTLNIWRVHQILVQDVLVQCYYSLEEGNNQPKSYDSQVVQCMADAQAAINAILASTPYNHITNTTKQGDVPHDASPAIRKMLNSMTYSHPLLICSMVKTLSNKHRADVHHLRKLNAASFGHQTPFRNFEPIYLPSREDVFDSTPVAQSLSCATS